MADLSWRRILTALVLLAAGACSDSAPKPPSSGYGYGGYNSAGKFHDDAQTNTQVKPGALDLMFKDAQGHSVDLKQYRHKKNLVLVVTRGFPGYVCPNCSAQTSRLIGNYPEFTKRDAEVLVVFPGPTDHLEEFIKKVQSEAAATTTPFPFLLDENFMAVDQLGIRGDLAKPATYIIDKEGEVRFAYVGANSADRPSLKAILDQLDAIAKTPPAGSKA
jgi:peroxiredoxin